MFKNLYKSTNPGNSLNISAFFVLLLCGVFLPESKSQVIGMDTLVYNCPTNHCLNIVMLGDGYTEGEMDKYQDDAAEIIDHLFEEAPFSNYRDYFNVFLVKVVSQESGIKHASTADDCPAEDIHPISNPNNYFGTRFDVAGIHRLVVPQNNGLVVAALVGTIPEYDIVMILANTPFYGGSGGAFATTTTHTNAKLIAIHELGHSFSGLADEYYAGPQYMFERPNLTQDNNPGTIKWNNWLTPETSIGIFPHSGDPDWYKPTHQHCMMEQLNKHFCEVCSETTTYKIISLVNPILAHFPSNQTVDITESETFSLDLLLPEPNTLEITWELNGLYLDHDSSYITMDANLLDPGLNILAAKVTDKTTLIRKNAPEYYAAWSINFQPTSSNQLTAESMEIRIVPNPAGHHTRIYTGSTALVSLEIYDHLGRSVKSVMDYYPGTSLDLSSLPAGLYFATIFKDMQMATATFIKP